MNFEIAPFPPLPYAFSYNDIKLEDKFINYRTLEIKGRGSTSIIFEEDQVDVGTKISNQKIPPNTLEVSYIYYFDSKVDIAEQQRLLKQFLYTEIDVPIVFGDEPNFTYYGRLSKFDGDDVKIYANCYVGKYEIYCQNPFKYSMTKESGSTIWINSPTKTTPEKIEIHLLRDKNIQVKNKNTGSVMRITDGQIKAGDELLFLFDEGILLVNGINQTSDIDLESDFENFYVHQGDILECDNGTMTIFCREVHL